MSERGPIFGGQHADYVAKDLWRESRLTRVLHCINQETGDDVVIKVSRRRTVFDNAESAFHDSFTDFFGDGAAHCLVEHEAFALQGLDDPRIVPLIDHGLFDGHRFIVTKRIPGRMLRASTDSPWPAASAKQLAVELLRALEHLRQHRTVHRDLRPENIIVSNPAEPALTLIDFELASVDGHCVPGRVGDSRYRAPERYASMHLENDHRADLYSAGAILYELLAGRLPFPEGPACRLAHAVGALPDLQPLCPDVPAEVRGVIHRLLSKRPDDRFSSAGEALEALTQQASASPGRQDRIDDSRCEQTDAAEWLRQARRYRSAGLFGDSLDAVRRACAAREDDPDARAMLAAILAALGASSDAQALASQAAALSGGAATTLVPLALSNVQLGQVQDARHAVRDLLTAQGREPEVDDLRDLSFALLEAGCPGDAVSVALYTRQCHDSDAANSVLLEISGTLAGSWTDETRDPDLLFPLCVACTQIALDASCRGDDACRRFGRALEVGRAAVLDAPEACTPELVLHLAVAEQAVGEQAFAARLRESVASANLLPSSEAGRVVNDALVRSPEAAVVVALFIAGQRRLANAFVSALPTRDGTPREDVTALERFVESWPP